MATAPLGVAAAHRYFEKLSGTVGAIVTGSNADQTKLTALHDEFVRSAAPVDRRPFRVASGNPLRRAPWMIH